MFTGLVEDVGVLTAAVPVPGGVRLAISTTLAADVEPGASLAVNGVCLTVISAERGIVEADVGPETLRVTTLGGLTPGRLANLERPLRVDGRLGGHFVLGHVDGVGRIESTRDAEDFKWYSVRYPASLAPYLILKGSVAVDGISLTVAALGAECFDVQIVPFTLAHTNLCELAAGAAVNLECDMVGKYVVRAAAMAVSAGLPGRSLDVS
jgi:riboflavin synthase